MTINNVELTREELEKLLEHKLANIKDLDKNEKDSNYIKELSDVALIQLQLEEYSKSEENYLVCLTYFTKLDDKLGQAAVYGVLGTLNYKKNEFLKSIGFYEKAFGINKKMNQIQEQITCLKGIGNSYIKLHKWDDACNTLLNCSTLCSDNDDIYNLLDCLGNLIYIYEINEEWDIIFELYKKSLKVFKEIKDAKGVITSYFNLGIIEKKKDKLEEAVRYFKKGTNIAIESNYVESIIRGLSYVGEALFYLRRRREAKDQFLKALRIANKIKADNAIIQLNVLLKSLGLSNDELS
ncbi:hypothetical protein LCGC14_1152720 [marine sediment metagenome]|uniref:MalT-like TPR region domain-containing protein n=1 Tax=marine sediment metagenome TaxID=412755 RepID=A0A0F9LUY4_9ZZZZ